MQTSLKNLSNVSYIILSKARVEIPYGKGGLNSKIIFATIWLIFSWMVTILICVGVIICMLHIGTEHSKESTPALRWSGNYISLTCSTTTTTMI